MELLMGKQEFIKSLNRYKHILPKQTIKTIRGQAIKGDLKGANAGLRKVLGRENVMTMAHRQSKIYVGLYQSDYSAQLSLSLRECHDIKKNLN